MTACAREGCDRPARAKKANKPGRYCSDACRVADWRARNGYLPVAQMRAARTRFVRKERPSVSGSPRKPRRSDVKIAYDRVVDLLAEHVGEQRARELAAGQITDRQRALLDSLD